MCSDAGDWTGLQPGSPIRKSLDHSSVTSSPRLIAGSYVLHRLLVPRHPPCALKNLTTKIKDARVHCAVLKLRTATTPTPAPQPTHPHTGEQASGTPRNGPHEQGHHPHHHGRTGNPHPEKPEPHTPTHRQHTPADG